MNARAALGRATDLAQVLLGTCAVPWFALARRHFPEPLARARHEPWAARGDNYMQHARSRDKALYLARLTLTEGLLTRSSPRPVRNFRSSTDEVLAEVIFLGDALAVNGLDASVFSPALVSRLRKADAVCLNWEGVVDDTTREIAPLFTARGVQQLAEHARLEGKGTGWSSSFDRAAAGCLLGLGRHTIANLANNHSLDTGAHAFAKTSSWLRRHGATVTGGFAPTLVRVGNAHLGILGLAYGSNRADRALPFVTIEQMSDAWLERMRHQMSGCTHRIALLHWGHEYEWLPSPQQQAIVHKLARHGFCAVVGHHPHVVQPHYREGKAWVSTSLGDFLGGDRTPFSRLGVGLVLRLLADGTVHGQPLGLAQAPAWAPRPKVMLLAEAPRFERTLATFIAAARRGSIPLYGARGTR